MPDAYSQAVGWALQYGICVANPDASPRSLRALQEDIRVHRRLHRLDDLGEPQRLSALEWVDAILDNLGRRNRAFPMYVMPMYFKEPPMPPMPPTSEVVARLRGHATQQG